MGRRRLTGRRCLGVATGGEFPCHCHRRRQVPCPARHPLDDDGHLPPDVLALKFVMHDALGGGAPRSLRADNLGKTLGAALLRLEIEVPDDVAANARRRHAPVNR